jgi:hypothetical protein
LGSGLATIPAALFIALNAILNILRAWTNVLSRVPFGIFARTEANRSRVAGRALRPPTIGPLIHNVKHRRGFVSGFRFGLRRVVHVPVIGSFQDSCKQKRQEIDMSW